MRRLVGELPTEAANEARLDKPGSHHIEGALRAFLMLYDDPILIVSVDRLLTAQPLSALREQGSPHGH